ncbi:MAG: hypothetical protein GWO02_17990 [Gammaproteobacteria bacterium]|nr:hypothetical protein [Gammaproteobacteria bacterium]
MDALVRFAPILLLFLLGVALRRAGIARTEHGDRLLAVVVWVGLPALVLATITRISLEPALALLPLAAIFTILVTAPVVIGLGRALRLPRRTLGAFVIGPLIMNPAVEYPFVLMAWGDAGVAHLALFDLGNAVLVLTAVYGLAHWFGSEAGERSRPLRRVATFPPAWAFVIALVLNLTGVGLPHAAAGVLLEIGRWVVFLVIVAMGIYFDVRLVGSGTLLLAAAVRIGVGGLLGALWILAFDLEGMTRNVVLLGTLAPAGFNTVVFAARENLDRAFASSLASLSVLLGLLYIPLLLVVLE